MKQYPLNVRNIDFIRYGANAIFRVTDTQNKRYVLRISPVGYHTKQAFLEEIKWLHHILKTTDLLVPKPVLTTHDQYLIEYAHPAISTIRLCHMFEWIPGKIRWKSIDKQYAYHLGSIIAQLQKSGQDIAIKHRHYWNTDGLVGTDRAKFYNVEKLTAVSKKEQDIITKARRTVYQTLKHYEESYKDKTGLIHSDMQPNNFLTYKNKYAVIDFDDCGVGLYGDDLAVALFAFEYLTEGEKSKNFLELKEALFTGYSTYMPLSQEDIDLSPYFLLARKLVTISWLELRRSNPKLRPYYRQAIARAITFFEGLEKNKR
ncbi:phosphotransferase enzyme family protein [Legionella lansingensis]|uniref:phosphotransferase enzyme family protein n=1 Tax=Legionella lansingensis TaxID=45067 RepID=UPI001B806112|nr:phosphotransferase [Legionella lansingensis]